MLGSVRAFAREGKPVYAECGGMLYLAQSLTARATERHTRWRRASASLRDDRAPGQVRLCDREAYARTACWARRARRCAGTAFTTRSMLDEPAVETCYEVTYSLAKREEAEGFRVGNVLASYVHLHFRTAPGIAASVRRGGACSATRGGPCMKRCSLLLLACWRRFPASAAARSLTKPAARSPCPTIRTASSAWCPASRTASSRSARATTWSPSATTSSTRPRRCRSPASAPSATHRSKPSSPSIPTSSSASRDNTQQASLDKIAQLGIPVYLVDPHGLAGIFHSLLELGPPSNREPQAARARRTPASPRRRGAAAA